ncbi:MAG TPA: outer membrane beta-barrel protein, partial [Vicinamibacterales bacterium]
AAQIHDRMRPNGEIDVRADIESEEFSGGIGYELSPTSKVYGAAIKTDIDYEDAFQDNVSLDQVLSHTTVEYSGGVKTDLTPLTTLLVRGGVRRDEFPTAPERNGENRLAAISLSFDPAAIISGTASFGYQDYVPDDPLVSRYQGMTANVSIRYPLLELGHFNFGYQHGIDYSFDVQEAYYVSNSFNVAYTQRLFGEVDLQASGTWGLFDYGQRVGSQERQDSLDVYNGNLGYNLRNRTRVAMNYELAERHSPAVAARNYVRRRIYLSWLVAF